MDFARAEGQMRRPVSDTDRTPLRAHLIFAAAAGSAKARARLDTLPQMPDALGYLWAWFMELDVARGVDMNGPVALSYLTIDAWARLTDRRLSPDEVQGIMMLDLALRHPGDEDVVH
jgi:hypothetical protein